MGDKLGVMTAVDGFAFSHSVDDVEVASGPKVLSTVMAPIPSAVDGAPMVVGLEMVILVGKMDIPQMPIFVNTKTRGDADYYYQTERRFRTRTIIWDRGDAIASYGDDGAIFFGGSPAQNDDMSYQFTTIAQTVTRVDSQDTILSPSVSEDVWEHISNYNRGGEVFSDIYQYMFDGTVFADTSPVAKKWGILGSAPPYDYGGVTIPGIMPQVGFGIFDSSPITVFADETTATANGTSVVWFEFDGTGAFVGTNGGLPSSQTATLSNEWTPGDTAGQISDMLTYLGAQDIGSIWAGTPDDLLGGVEYKFPINGHQIGPPEKWPSGLGPAFAGPDHVILFDYTDVTTINTQLTAAGADHFYDGAIYPISEAGSISGGYYEPIGFTHTAPPAPSGGDYGVASTRTTRRQAMRAQVKSLGATISYTILEIINTIDIVGGTTYINRWFLHELGSGVVLPGAIVEMPPPSRTDLPFISTNGGVSVCATYVDVLFVPILTAAEYFALFDAGDGEKYLVPSF